MKYTVDIPENLRNNPSKVREAFQKAIDEANLSGGGTVYIPSGKYTVCMVDLKSRVNLELDSECIISLPYDSAEYELVRGKEVPPIAPCKFDCMFYANDCCDISITGGTLEGNGEKFWTLKPGIENTDTSKNTVIKYDHTDFRPMLITFQNSVNVMLDNITLNNSPVYSVWAINCCSAVFKRININNNFYGPNTDGIHISSCINTVIDRCSFITGDDSIAIDSDYAGCSRGLYINNCNFRTSVNVIRVYCGIEKGNPYGTVKDVSMSHCTVSEASGVINITAECGLIENVEFYDIKAKCTLEGTPVFVMTFNEGEIKNISFKNITVTKSNGIATILGRENNRIKNISFDDCEITCSPKAKIYDTGITGELEHYWLHHYAPCNLFMRCCDNIIFKGFKVIWQKNKHFNKKLEAKHIENCTDIEFINSDIPQYSINCSEN